jgi:hypothetical protein
MNILELEFTIFEYICIDCEFFHFVDMEEDVGKTRLCRESRAHASARLANPPRNLFTETWFGEYFPIQNYFFPKTSVCRI